MKTFRMVKSLISGVAHGICRRKAAMAWVVILVTTLLVSQSVMPYRIALADFPADDGDDWCAQFADVSREGDLGERASLSGPTHAVQRPFTSPRGWDGNVILRWTQPPNVICDGDTFTFSIEAENLVTHSEDPGGHAAHISLAPVGPAWLSMECTNPYPYDPISAVHLMAPDAAGSNSCRATVRVLPRDATQPMQTIFIARLGAGPFNGTVSYDYKIMPRSELEESPGNDLATDEHTVVDGAPIATGAMLIAEDRTVESGRTVQVPIRLHQAQDIGSMNFVVTYDPQVLRVLAVQRGFLLSRVMLATNHGEPPLIRFGFATTDGVSGNGPVAYVKLQAIGPEGSSSPLTFSQVVPKDTSGRDLSVSTQSGTVTIETKTLLGDYNGDGRVTELDALAALRMSVKLLEEDLILDMDKDGRVTADDARLILVLAVRGR